MNLEARKILFIQEFLKLQQEEVISRFEKFLEREKKTINDPVFEPMSKETLNARIDQSEADFRNKRFKSSSELVKKYTTTH